ncbi:MAG: hypothetical protein QOK59_02640 [Nitrososphaeraceae archaeon]|nr:hypothetical protein [Nitrososphaeraceae archaeon]MDW0167486.1 hypothetical protein [Nitrososphaeraceae archaeon]
MSENRFVSGNVIVLYCNFVKLESKELLPQHIIERIAVCTRIYERIMKSKPDKSDTIIKVAADGEVGYIVKNNLLNNGIDESMIAVEGSYNNIGHLFSVLMAEIKKRPNPPMIYFVSSYQQKNIFDKATALYNGYKIQFEGAFDKRPIDDIEEDAKREKLSKKFTNIKEKGKNKMVDMLLNYIFPESKKRQSS